MILNYLILTKGQTPKPFRNIYLHPIQILIFIATKVTLIRQITIEHSTDKPVEQAKVNICERKGIGHPDTLIDMLCNSSSNALSKYYLNHFGSVLHHNVDKGLIVAGQSKPRFKGGKIIKPMEIIIAGRATAHVGKKRIDVDSLIKKDAVSHMGAFRELKGNYILDTKVKEGAANLKEVFKTRTAVANDTSFGVAHAPLSRTEQLCLDVSDFINFRLSKRIKAIGLDTKVMAVKKENTFYLTLAIAFIDRYVSSMQDYIRIKDKVKDQVKAFVKKKHNISCIIDMNTLDNTDGDESTIYLTVTGLSAEHGDDGQVGRGNRPSGLITPDRPMSLEATAGKNINHPGKLYQCLAQIIATRISRLNGVEECYVKMLTQIGKPLDEPLVSVDIIGNNFHHNKIKSEKIINDVLDNIPRIQKDIIYGKYKLF